MQTKIMHTLIEATTLERQRIEEPKNRSRYFIFSKTEEYLDKDRYIIVFQNVPDRVLIDAQWKNLHHEEALFRVGDLFINGYMKPIGERLHISFSTQEFKQFKIDPQVIKQATDNGIDYVMDNRKLMDYLLNFLERNEHVNNSFLYPLILTKDEKSINPLITKINYYNLNTSQKRAVQKALNQKVTFMWGPPGTGKTKTLGALTANLIKNKRQVLLTALSNMALDQLLLTTLKFLGNTVSHTSIARLGSRMDEKVKGYSKNAFLNNEFESNKTGCSWEQHVENASLIAGNFTYLTLPNASLPKQCDYVIADEVSMANIPSITATSFYARYGFVVGGDPHQLPPIYPEDAEQPNKFFSANIFELADITNTDDPRAAFLNTQYRMQEPIGNLVSDLFYKKVGGLKTGTNPVEGHPDRIIFINCPGMVETLNYDSNVHRRFNKSHAEVIATVVKKIISQGARPSEIGIIAPYNAQVVQITKTLHSVLQRSRIDSSEIKVATVHSFQGQEKTIMIVDFTDNDIEPTTLTAKWQLINVALSRAKEYLIIIGNREYLNNSQYFKPNEVKTFEKLMQHCKIEDYTAL